MKQKTLCSCQSCKSGKCDICRNALYGLEGMKVIEHGLIRSEQDIMKLNIIDWKRFHPWPDPQAAMHTIFSWFNKSAHYTIAEEDMKTCPQRDDFPKWDHVGDHEAYGQLYWNWFHYWHEGQGTLLFSDSPDFQGTFTNQGETTCFWGDIGQCSPVALAHSQKQMRKGDMWISIRSANVQIIIESSVNLLSLFGESFGVDIDTSPEALPLLVEEHVQLPLFD